MSTHPDTIAFIEEQLGGLPIRTRPMFGEYGIYCDDVFVGVICDDRLFLKRSKADPELFAQTSLEAAYSGASPSHAVPRFLLEDADWLTRAVRATAEALPPPKKRKG
ncbi:MAG: TfoX/Sxy family protein [Pseudolysinimonas sp.]